MTTQYDPLAAIKAADAATKGQLDPQSVVGAASAASSVPEAVMNAQAMGSYGNTTKLYNSLHSMSTASQATAWKGFDPKEQDQLEAIGYRVPNVEALTHSGAGGLWGDVWSLVASGYHTVASAGEKIVKDALKVAGSPIRFVQHLYRTGHVLSEEGVASAHGWTYVGKKAESSGLTLTPAAFKDILSPSAWAQAWRETTTGNTTLDPALKRKLDSQYGRSKVSLALRVVASGETSVITSTPVPRRQALVAEITTPKFRQLMTEVGNARMSLGRNVVGSTFLNQHPDAGKIISGGIDAAFDVAGTPTLMVGKAAKAARIVQYGVDDATVARYLAGDASKMDELLNSSKGVQRYIDHVGTYLERGDYAGLTRFDPRLDNVVATLAREGIDSADAYRDWLSGQAGLRAVLDGSAAKISEGMAIMPHLSLAGWFKTGVKEALQNGLDRLADVKVPGLDSVAVDDRDVGGAGDTAYQFSVGGKPKTLEGLLRSDARRGLISKWREPARWIRRVTTLIATKPYLDIGDDADIANLRRFLQGFLPAKRVDDVINIFLGSDLGERYRIVTAARQQMMEAFGATRTAEGAANSQALLAAVGEMERRQAYSVNDLDLLTGDDGKATRSAVLDSQLSNRVALPLPQEVRQLARQQSLLKRLLISPATRLMYWWRTMILDRPSFAVRFSLTENLNRLLRTGGKKFLGSYLANGAAYTRTDDEIAAEVDRLIGDGEIAAGERDAAIAAKKALSLKPLMPYHPVERSLAALGEHVPSGVRPYVDSAEKFYGAVLGGMTRQWARAAERGGLKALDLEDYITAATHLYTHQPVADAFQDEVAAMVGNAGFVYSPDAAAAAAKDGADIMAVGFRSGGTYSEAAPGDPLWVRRWQTSLDQIAHSKLGRAVLEAMDKTTRTQDRAVLRVLEDPDFADTKAQFARATRLPDGRTVGVDATQHEADLAFARTVRKHVNALVRSGDPEKGPVLQHLVDEMKETGRGPAKESLDAVDIRDAPASIYGKDALRVYPKQSIVSKSMETLVGKPANWLARQPHFIQAYAEALPSARAFAHGIIANDEEAETLASDIATDRAVNSMSGYIHNPSLRTQFEDQHRILLPFLFAQRQFLQRWGRAIVDSPDLIRKLQLTMQGLRTVGLLTKNATGQTIFQYPGSQYVTSLVTHVLARLGIKAYEPLSVPFTGAVQYLEPGLSNPALPSVGPFAAVGLKELANLHPELTDAANTLLQEGSTTPLWQEFTPTVFNRVWDAITANQRTSELASMSMQAIKYLDASGHGLSPTATAEDTETYVRRVENWARTLLVMKAALGFLILPATPKPTLDPQKLSTEWHTLITELGYTHGTAQFVKDHPDATAYTVGESQIMTDGYTPATKASADFLNAHLQLAQTYPLAAAWFIPRTTGAYTPAAYREQIALGVRRLRTVSSTSPSTPGFLQEVVMARASNTYYAHETAFQKAYTDTASSHEHQVLLNGWDNWKASFFKRNPVFAKYKTSEDAHIRRLTTIRQITEALDSGLVPDTPQAKQLDRLVRTYNQFVTEYTSTVGLYSSADTRERRQLKTAMVAWGNNYVATHRTVATFWVTVVRIEVEDQT